MLESPIYFETWPWYGDEVNAPFPTTFGGITFGVGSELADFIYWSADLQVSIGEGRGRPVFSYSIGVPVTVGLITPNKKYPRLKIGLFGGPQRFGHKEEPEYAYHTVIYYGATSGIVFPIANNSINLDVFVAPKLKVHQNPSRGYWRKPMKDFRHLRFSITYQWNRRSK